MPAPFSPSATTACPGPQYIGDLGRNGLDLKHWRAGSSDSKQEAAGLTRSWTDGSLGLFVHEITARNLHIIAAATDDLLAIALPLEARPDRTLTVEQVSTAERPHLIEIISLPRHSSIAIMGAEIGMTSITLLVRAADIPDLLGPIEGLPQTIARLIGEQRSMIRSHAFPCSVERVAHEILDAARGDRFSPLFCRYKSAELLNALLEFCILEDRDVEASLCTDRERQGVIRVRERIERDPIRMHPIVELASLAGMNRTKLRALFKQLCGMTMVDLRTDALMRRADAMLQRSDLSIAEIGFQLGYSDPSSFNTAYRRFFGHTPGRTRRK